MIHLLAVAGSCRRVIPALGCRQVDELIQLIQTAVGPSYHVSGDYRLIDAEEDENRGGRSDDARRAADLQSALGDDRVVGIVSLRGGSWLTRILPRIDFGVLAKRKSVVSLFGFSELTTVLNIAAGYATARCYYDLGPAFLRSGLADYARCRVAELEPDHAASPAEAQAFATGWAAARFRGEFVKFFADVVSIVEGRGSGRSIIGTLSAGKLEREQQALFVGGTLSVMTPLIGTPYQSAIETDGKWLVLEDVNEAPYRVDRALAHLNLAGLLKRCDGLLVGDFHDAWGDRTPAVLECLKRHLPPGSQKPIVVTRDVGHIWPMSPLPLGRPVVLRVPRTSARGSRVDFETT